MSLAFYHQTIYCQHFSVAGKQFFMSLSRFCTFTLVSDYLFKEVYKQLWRTERVSPFGAKSKVLTVCYKRFGFPKLRISLLKCSPLSMAMRCLLDLFTSSCGNWGFRNWQGNKSPDILAPAPAVRTSFVSEPGVLYLLPASRKTWLTC